MMPARRNPLWAATLLVTLGAAASFGAGAESAPPAPEAMPISPEQIAVDSYNSGLKLREKAVEIDAQLATETEAKKRAKLEGKREELFEKAAQRYQAAIEAKPDFVEAHGSLGYALRRLGRFEASMAAYDTALGMNPNYPAAIEYRAEALLGLGRVEEVKEAYQHLSMVSAEHAAQLLTAVKAWAADQANTAVAEAAGVGDWAAAQEQASAATGAGAEGGAARWR